MKVDDVKLGMEVLATSGIVGHIRGIKYGDSFDNIVVIIRSEDCRLYEVPLNSIQPIIYYVPRVDDTIKFYNNNNTLSGVVMGIGMREKDYVLFVRTNGKKLDFIMISSKQVFEHHIASYYCVSGEKVD